jgi:hypothetical protein
MAKQPNKTEKNVMKSLCKIARHLRRYKELDDISAAVWLESLADGIKRRKITVQD